MAIGSFGFAILENVSYLCVGELHTLNGISVAGFTIAQGGGGAAAQDIVYAGFIIDTSGYIGAVPYAVFFGIGQIVLVDGQRTDLGFIDGGHIGQLRSGGGHREGQEQSQSQEQGKNFCDVFHRAVSFLECNFEIGF